MTYQSASEHFAARIPASGQSITSAPFLTARRGLDLVVSMFTSIGTGLAKAAEASSRTRQVEVLQSKSDDELAALGIKRDDIAYHVFKDLFYV
ncbi:hypothetical protein [Sulfitobacter sp.]|jgi:hypothetical protein|uniref:hypothetical protein n=1 Tax=Sulfitobacter sp. TaxID=1903071 RepID=UPI0030036434